MDGGSKPLNTKVWLMLSLGNWVFDFGRPIFGLYLSDALPISSMSVGDYSHLAYNIVAGLCLMRLMEECSNPAPKFVQQLLIIFFVMGASIHLVGDSVQHRLLRSGAYQLHLQVDEQPFFKADRNNASSPAAIRDVFKLLDFYDDGLGHTMWHLALFLAYVVCFYGCFSGSSTSCSTTSSSAGSSISSVQDSTSPPLAQSSLGMESRICWLALLSASSLAEWYIVTEGQTFWVFASTLACCVLILAWRQWNGYVLDHDGTFILAKFLATLLVIVVWVVALWDDKQLRKKYTDFTIYIPEPWSYVSLHWK